MFMEILVGEETTTREEPRTDRRQGPGEELRQDRSGGDG